MRLILISLFLCSNVYAMEPFVVAGGSWHNGPENGSWFDAQDPYSFSLKSYDLGVGIKGDHWAAWVEDLGRVGGWAQVQGYNWYSVEHERGVWLDYEPSRGMFFGQVGIGVVWPNFEVQAYGIPQRCNTPPPYNAGNNNPAPSYLLGIGYHINAHLDAVINERYVYTQGTPYGLDKFVTIVGIRWAL